MSPEFENRLEPALESIADHFGTPFYLYDAEGIDHHATAFTNAFEGIDSREFFPVKALPNPRILQRLAAHGFGFDCGSPTDLALALRVGASGRDIIYTSNNTDLDELTAALDVGALLTIDDGETLDLLAAAGRVPEDLMIRINPGDRAPRYATPTFRTAREAKFGVPTDRLLEVCRRAGRAGVRRLGLHMMISSNWLDPEPALFTLDVLAEQALTLRDELGIEVAWLDVGGGFGIPFRPDEPALDLAAVAARYRAAMASWPADWRPTICFEHGIHMTGAHGVLVTRVRQRMSKWREIVGVDVSTNALMRPVLYHDAYHHVTVPGATDRPTEIVDVVGSLCTDLDRIAHRRALPALVPGDLLVVHDTGAHGHAWGHNYNGRLRPQELLLHGDGTVELIRRAETAVDYFATLSFAPRTLSPAPAVG